MSDLFDVNLQILPEFGNQMFLPALKEIARLPLQQVSECPLCGHKHFEVIARFAINDLILAWQTKLGFNPIADVYQNKLLEKRRCLNCGLGFYNYHLSDCITLYQQIEAKMPVYYPTFRSEYAIAAHLIEHFHPQKFLEIGAGRGDFLQLIKNKVPNVFANDTNPAAVDYCQQKGITIYDCLLSEIKDKFDFICSFELFEHIADGKGFFEQCLSHLEPTGYLLIATPNPDSILKVIGNGIFNLPPHHQFDYSYQSFEYLADLYHLKIIHYEESVLSYRHYAKYVQQMIDKNLDESDIMEFDLARKHYSGVSHTIVFSR